MVCKLIGRTSADMLGARVSCELILQKFRKEKWPASQITRRFSRRRSHCELDEVMLGLKSPISRSELEFGEVIGEGSTGIVFKALWRGKTCAAKMLKHGVQHDAPEYRDLITELSILTKLGSHRNLVSFYGANMEDLEAPVIIEEYMEGPDLESFLGGKHTGFDLGKANILRWSVDILSALNHLHDRDPIIMHRDLKPSNILLSRDRKLLKLADFGLAKEVCRDERTSSAHASNTGTLRYMAPEVVVQLNDEEDDIDSAGGTNDDTYTAAGCQAAAAYSEKADIYSASLVIWYILTGMKPHIDISQHPLERPNTALSKKRCAEISHLLQRMWHHQPECRPSARECLEHLEGLSTSACVRGCWPMR